MSASLDELIEYPFEERHIEFKSSTAWDEKEFKAKITKTILALANIKDGGFIVIGKVEQTDGTHTPVGMTDDDYNSYTSDSVKDFVKDYADPYVDLTVFKPQHNGLKFAVIKVNEFANSPVICKKGYGKVMHRGKIYTRSRGKAETIEVPTENEMRDILDIAIDKKLRNEINRFSQLGLIISQTRISTTEDQQSFDKQIEDLK